MELEGAGWAQSQAKFGPPEAFDATLMILDEIFKPFRNTEEVLQQGWEGELRPRLTLADGLTPHDKDFSIKFLLC